MYEEQKHNLRENLLNNSIRNQLPIIEEEKQARPEQSLIANNNINNINSNDFDEIENVKQFILFYLNLLEQEFNEDYDPEQIQFQVRNNLQKSLKFLIIQLIISFLKILTSIIILICYQCPCEDKGIEETGERLFLYFMIVYDFIFFIMNSIYLKLSLHVLAIDAIEVSHMFENYEEQYLNNQQQRRYIDPNQNYIDSKYWYLRTTKDILEIFYLILWIWGQSTIYFFQVTCKNNAPGIYYLIIVYIVFGFLSICFPIIILILACLCFPFVFLLALYLGRRSNQTPINKKLLNSLKISKYNQKSINDEECLICMVQYEQDDDIIQLPCHQKHFFHAECIKKWLLINGICPVCRIRPENKKN